MNKDNKNSELNNADKKIHVSDVKQRLYITKTKWGIYELLNEQQYERKLIYG